MVAADFSRLEQEMSRGGVAAALDNLVEQLRANKQYHELFEALRMRLRNKLGLPLATGGVEHLSEQQRTSLELGLVEACREIGTTLLSLGRLREGWMYMRPVGDTPAVIEQLKQVTIDEDNLEEFLDVTIQERVWPEEGYRAVLKHYGTCNAITAFETQIGSFDKSVQQTAAADLVRHLHADLMGNLRSEIQRAERVEPTEPTIREMIEHREWLFGENSYHIDTTHLNSTVRFSRLLDDKDTLRLALDLTEYGRRLSPHFQHGDDEPFGDYYPASALFFQAILGENTDAALAYFRAKADECDPATGGTLPAEMYVNLLDRVGRPAEAMEALLKYLPPPARTMGVAPTLAELSQRAGSYDRYLQACREQGDLLGFAQGMLQVRK